MRGKPEADPRVSDLAEDLAEYGAERVEDALRRAKEGDNRGGVSIAFYRAILRGAAPSAGSPPRPEGRAPDPGYLRRKYTEADFRAMEVDLDAEDFP